MDVYQDYGNDLVVANTGDLAIADGPLLSNQRIVRRLLTTPINVIPIPDYIDHPDYGAGLPQFIGMSNTTDTYNLITGNILSSMMMESTVSQNPPPVITVTGLPNQINVNITYTNVLTTSQSVINFVVPQPLPNTLYATINTANAT